MNALTLNDKHRAELHASGLMDTMIEAAGIYTGRSEQIRDILGWTPKQNGKPIMSWGPGIVFPFRTPDGADTGYGRVKLDHPRHQDGKPIKYESPHRKRNRAYFPPGFAQSAESKAPIVFTEGEKKSLAVAQAGYAAIGLVGVWGWQQRRKRNDHGKAYGERMLIPDIDTLDWKGRDVVIVFDSDVSEKSDVQLAEARLAEALTELGAKVRTARIPATGDKKVGIDDYLVAQDGNDSDALAKLLDAADEPEQPRSTGPMNWAKSYLADEHTRNGMPTLQWWRDEFWTWEGRRYISISESELEARVLGWMDKRGFEAKPRQSAEVVKCLRSICRVDSSVEWPTFLDSSQAADPKRIIAFNNGLLDTANLGTELAMTVHSPVWFSPSVLPYDFDESATCPNWLNFLASSLGDKELIELLCRWFGYLLTWDTSQQKLLLLVGPPRAGKGVICRTIHRVVGEDACTSPVLSSLASDFGLWPLLDKQVAVLADAHLGRRADDMRVLETLKAIVGEDRLNVNRKHLSYLRNVKLGVRFGLSCNELPHFTDASGALAARMCIIPFSKSFVGREDQTLDVKLTAESPGIFNWALRGLYRLRNDGRFNEPSASQAILDNYKRLSSPVGTFLDECCSVEPGSRQHCNDVFAAWSEWADQNGHKPGSSATFGERLRTCHPEIVRRRGRENGDRPYFYDGVNLNDFGQDLAERFAESATKKVRGG